jgi:L-threonylcarbamoyladenylate synthase
MNDSRTRGCVSESTAEILPTHTPALFANAVRHAADLLRAGNVVALPTETVYGLAANALDADAVEKIYEIKGRPAHNPIIVHVASIEMAKRCVANWPESAGKLANAFWPGPLTLVLVRETTIPDIVTAGGETVGVRWPGHPFIQAVIRECGFPLAAPSANLSGRVSPTNAGHVAAQIGERIPLIVDGGQSQVGIESTVIDLIATPPRVLRPGMIHEESLAAVIGEGLPETATNRLPGAPASCRPVAEEVQELAGKMPALPVRSPGLLDKHYAPKAKLLVLDWKSDCDLESRIANHVSRFTFHASHTHIIAHTHIPAMKQFGRVSVIPHDAEAFARALYAELHRCDEAGAELIVVESPPDLPEWRAIADRLRRASMDL